MNKTLFWDIETEAREEADVMRFFPAYDGNPDDGQPATQVEYVARCMAKAALSALTGRVLAIGLLCRHEGGNESISILANPMSDDKDEAELLRQWWHGCFLNKISGQGDKGPQYIGFNSRNFDLPFLAQRSWALGVKVPGWITDGHGLPHPMFVDLKERWAVGGRSRFEADLARRSLDNICRLVGVPTKNGDGSAFGRLWHGSELHRAAARFYLENDLRMMAELWDELAP